MKWQVNNVYDEAYKAAYARELEKIKNTPYEKRTTAPVVLPTRPVAAPVVQKPSFKMPPMPTGIDPVYMPFVQAGNQIGDELRKQKQQAVAQQLQQLNANVQKAASRKNSTAQAQAQYDAIGKQYSPAVYDAAVKNEPNFLEKMAGRVATSDFGQAFNLSQMMQGGTDVSAAQKILAQSAEEGQATNKRADDFVRQKEAKYYADMTQKRLALEGTAAQDAAFAVIARRGAAKGDAQTGERDRYDGGSPLLKAIKPLLNTLGRIDPTNIGNVDTLAENEAIKAGEWRERAPYLTDNQMAVYNYYIGKGDAKTAEEYLQTLERAINAADTQEKEAKAYDTAANNGALGKLYGVGMNFAASAAAPAAMVDAAAGAVKSFGGSYAPLDVNAGGLASQKVGDAATQGLTEGMSDAQRFLTQVGLSGANNIANVVMFGPAAPAMMAVQSAGRGAYDAAQKGGTPTQALLQGTANGVAEYLGEKFSFKKLQNVLHGAPARNVKDFIRVFGSQGINEFTEESATEVMNILSDVAIMRDKADVTQFAQDFLAANGNSSEAQKTLAMVLYVSKRVAGAGLAGLLSGTALGGAAQGVNTYQAAQLGKQINAQGGANAVISAGLAAPKGGGAQQMAAQLALKQIDGAPQRNIDLGAQYFANGAQSPTGTPRYSFPMVGEAWAPRPQENAQPQQKPSFPLIAQKRPKMIDDVTPLVASQMVNQNAQTATTKNAPVQTEAVGVNELMQEAMKVGRNTTIHRPYRGEQPTVKSNATYNIVRVQDAAIEAANKNMTDARTQTGTGFKKSLTNLYREAVGTLFNGRAVTVENVKFQDNPYDVTLNKNVVEKVISDKNLSAEKLAIFDTIESVVRNAEYLGSGEYMNHGGKTKTAKRYDYFETQASIGGQEYTVSFDVEVYPDKNNYRTHRIINNLELIPTQDGQKNIKKESLPLLSAVRTAYPGADMDPASTAAGRAIGSLPSIIANSTQNATGMQQKTENIAQEDAETDIERMDDAANGEPVTQDSVIRDMEKERVRKQTMAVREYYKRKAKNIDDVRDKNNVRDLITQHPIIMGVSNTQGARAALMADVDAKKFAAEFTQYSNAKSATANEVRNAKLMASGEIELNDIGRRDRPEVVKQLAEIQQKASAAKGEGVAGVKRQIFELQQAKYKALFYNLSDSVGVKLKKIGEFGLNARTPERVFLKTFGDELGQKLVDDAITPIHYNESAKIAGINELLNRARVLDLSETERRLVQLVGESIIGKNGRPITVHDIEMKNIGPESFPGHMDMREAKALLEHVKEADAQKVQKAVDYYRKTYKEFYEVIAEFRASRGLAQIGYKEDYFPHFSDDDPLVKTLKQLGIEGVGDLPTSIAGDTAWYRPNTRYVPYFQQREGPRTTYDSDLGYQSYVIAVMDMIYHTDDIIKLRNMDAAIRGKYTKLDLRDTIDSVLTKKNLPITEAEAEMMEKVMAGEYMDMEANKKYASFAGWLTQYTNKLANKQLLMDRGVEAGTGRLSLNLPDKIISAFGRNSVVGNFSSAINNTITASKIFTTLPQRDVASAVKGLVTGEFKKLDIASQSEFLTGKKGINMLVQSGTQKAAKWVSGHTFDPIETAVSDIAFYAKYIEQTRNGVNVQSAIIKANDYAALMMARRTKGARPLFMESKSPLAKLMTMFQTEIANDFFTMWDDLPRAIRDMEKTMSKTVIKNKVAAGMAKYVVYSYAINTVLESLTGFAPLPDPARWVIEFLTDLFDEDESQTKFENVTGAVGGLAENVGQVIPGLSTGLALAGIGNGRVPLPNYDWDKMEGGIGVLFESKENAPNKYVNAAQQLWKGFGVPTAMAVMPFGANQLKKTIEGADTMARGGLYKQSKAGAQLQTPVDNSLSLAGLENWGKALVFGKSAIKEVGDYYDGPQKMLSVEDTAKYEAAKKIGAGSAFLDMKGNADVNENKTMSYAEFLAWLKQEELEQGARALLWQQSASENKRKQYKQAQKKGIDEKFLRLEELTKGTTSQASVYEALQKIPYSESDKKALWDIYGWKTGYSDYK